MGNPFVHIELTTPDAAKAKEFYGALFDWTMEDVPLEGGGTYTIIKVSDSPLPGGAGGGMMQMQNMPTFWLSYVLVDDIKAATEKARKLGAHVVKDCHEVPGMGTLSIFTDPQGAVLALWQAKM